MLCRPHRCRIELLFDEAFVNQVKLHTLILTGNPLTFISTRAFRGLDSLVNLIMLQISIRDLGELPISDLRLETLDVSASRLNTLEGLLDISMTKMKLLNLARNHIPSISASELSVFKNARSDLDVSFACNDILSVEPGAFKSLHFRDLDFTNCFAKADESVVLRGLEGVTTETLSLGTFMGEPRRSIRTENLRSLCKMTVTRLNLQMQRWADLSSATFDCLGGLETLEMTEMHIERFPENITTMGKLLELNLDRNAFTNLCDIHAHNFPSLKVLSMRGNGVYRDHLIFGDSCLQKLSQLEYLDLSHSEVETQESCCGRQLQGLGNLHFLNLSYSYTMHWHALPFSATPELRHLDCSHVPVNLNESAPFQNLALLKTLNLSSTSVSVVHPHLLKGLKSLIRLEQSQNPVPGGVVSDPEIFSHVPLLESLVLAECKLIAIGENLFSALMKLTYVDLSANYLTKVSTFYSPIPIHLNFANNQIELVNIDSVKRLEPDSSIDLSYNPLVCNCSNIEFIDWVKANADKLVHFEETLCNATNGRVKPSEVNLKCNFYSGLTAFAIAAVVIIIIIIIVLTVRKIKRSGKYSVL